MLRHYSADSRTPERVVVLGARGFIARHLVDRLATLATPSLAIGSSEIDLSRDGAASILRSELRAGDAIVMLSALTPDRGRDLATLQRNLKMIENVIDALSPERCAHFVYMSSDAVYPKGVATVSEEACAAADTLYGVMHRAREIAIVNAAEWPVAIVRPTLVYGRGDTHDAYGPNRLVRQALETRRIHLFGRGEDVREHVFVDDVVELVTRILLRRSSGVLNAAGGEPLSYARLADVVEKLCGGRIDRVFEPRAQPITERRFDTRAVKHAFPDFSFTPLERGLATLFPASPDL